MENPVKVLVVDDEDMIRLTLSDCFEDEGFVVHSASSGEEGLEILKQEPVDVCTVDMRLPGMDGNDFILQAASLRPGIRYLIYTGSTDYSLPRELRDLGISWDTNVFIKPVEDLEILVRTVRGLVGLGELPTG